MVPPVRSPRSTAVCEDLSPFVCELRKRSKIVPKGELASRNACPTSKHGGIGYSSNLVLRRGGVLSI